MSELHRIRLEGHWQRTAVETRTACIRSFGAPRTLPDGESAWLEGAGWPELAEVTVNGLSIGVADSVFSFDATAILKPRNSVEIAWIGHPEAPVGSLALVIRGAAPSVS